MVYPRVGGETWDVYGTGPCASGLSPRGRGNRSQILQHAGQPGSIPAWAGKPEARAWWWRAIGVYPRVGGETYQEREKLRFDDGLSPRGRGNLAPDGTLAGIERSIPAWAGKP